MSTELETDEAAALVRELAPRLAEELDVQSREELEASAAFRDAVARVRRVVEERGTPVETLTALALDGDRWVSRLALAVLTGRDDLPPKWASQVLRRLGQAPYDQAGLFLSTLQGVRERVIPRVLAQLREVHDRDAAELIAARHASGRELVDETAFRRVKRRRAERIEELIEDHEDLVGFLREPFDAWRAGDLDPEYLNRFARVWARPFDSPPALLTAGRAALVEAVHGAVTADPSEPLLLVGEHGVGKTALVRAALERLPPAWTVFEATAAMVQAGSVWVGELETSVQELVGTLKGRKVVWVLPSLEETLYAGAHSRSPTGLLDLLLPHLQAGDLRVVAETSPAGFQTIAAARPHAATVFRAFRVRPLGERDAIAVGRHALESQRPDVAVSDDVLAESYELAEQFLPAAAPPGNLLGLLDRTAEEVAERGGSGLETADVLTALARVSGLPLMLLDAKARLDLGDVRTFLESRVLGQREAVDCLVERVALIKAGLTDPTRPLGVFLFVGPTGTGKTELAKTLAELLFGSPDRLVRLDMSEYQTPDSLERLITDTNLEPHGAPLVSSVRTEPFSVVLLDEFEKAAEPIWDLFLQVFDDGRLTDSHGRVVDFRRCVIILTGNIGSSIAGGPRLGFSRTTEPFRAEAVERAVREAFRREFLNRLDRVVVFRPFERSQMRALLEKELAEAVQRRGLRSRPWGVEYDESALDFLIEQGFTPELGARPLKRAVERYLLAPLAKAIVEQSVPEGEQFLFVTARAGRVDVRFVDPDADERAAAAAGAAGELDLRALTLAPRADAGAAAYLVAELRRLEEAAEGAEVRGRKDAALAAVAQPGFWDDDGRFPVLADVEYLDRFDAALRTAGKLGERLESRRDGGSAGELVELLASRLYVLDQALAGLAAGAPFDVFLRIRPARDPDAADGAAFAEALAGMYAGWAERRGMRLERIATDAAATYLFAVSGLGAGHILPPEAGLHVLEHETFEDGPSIERTTVAVQVAAWPPGERRGTAELRARAEEALAGAGLPAHVVRRYRTGPAPLVRDGVRGYRTGRLDRVLDGDFDLF